MTRREKEVLNILRNNPMISQEELAKKLGISRSSAGVHIGNLMKKGIVKGKGYILEDEQRALVVGGANIDMEGTPLNTLRLNDSNPGSIKTAFGGVGRNIAENLKRIGADVGLITCVGKDDPGRRIIDHAREIGIDTDYTEYSSTYSTSTYLAILDENHDMKVAISQMDVMKDLSPQRILRKMPLLKKAPAVCLDGNLRQDTIELLLDQLDPAPIFIDPVSTSFARKFKKGLPGAHTIKPNRAEAEELLDRKIRTTKDLCEAGEEFIKKGVKQAFISLGAKGVYFKTLKEEGIVSGTPQDIVSVTGAGDGFMAGLIYGYLMDWGTKKTAVFAQGVAYVNMLSEKTIHPELSVGFAEKQIRSANIQVQKISEEEKYERL